MLNKLIGFILFIFLILLLLLPKTIIKRFIDKFHKLRYVSAFASLAGFPAAGKTYHKNKLNNAYTFNKHKTLNTVDEKKKKFHYISTFFSHIRGKNLSLLKETECSRLPHLQKGSIVLNENKDRVIFNSAGLEATSACSQQPHQIPKTSQEIKHNRYVSARSCSLLLGNIQKLYHNSSRVLPLISSLSLLDAPSRLFYFESDSCKQLFKNYQSCNGHNSLIFLWFKESSTKNLVGLAGPQRYWGF